MVLLDFQQKSGYDMKTTSKLRKNHLLPDNWHAKEKHHGLIL